jgi:carbon storage regulator
MLVLTRREGETFKLGDDIEIEILDIKPGVVRVGIRAPKSVRILRSELVEAVASANQQASAAADLGADLAIVSSVVVESTPVARRSP